MDYSKQDYIVNNRSGWDLTTALRLWKTKYQDDYRDFQKEVIVHESLKDFDLFVQECWDGIEPFTVEEALKVVNTEERRTYFDAIGIEKLFKSLEPELLDRQVLKKYRTRWDDEFNEYTHEFEDVYELYQIEGTKLYDLDRWGNPPQPIYAVRCWCTTTNREYWLYVPREAALGENWWHRKVNNEDTPDAIRAIAWTIRLDVPISHVDRIYRQGDIIVTKLKDTDVPEVPQYHISKNDYIHLMYSET